MPSTPEVNWLLDAEMFDFYRAQRVLDIQQLSHDIRLIRAPKAGYSSLVPKLRLRTPAPEAPASDERRKVAQLNCRLAQRA